MITSGTFAPNAGALETLLDAGEGPVIVLDPCGSLWNTFFQTPRWSRLWQAWRLCPGQTQEGDVWNVISALKGVSALAGSSALAAALFPSNEYSDLTRELMSCMLQFTDETDHVRDLPALAGQLWADELWIAIARWSRKYPHSASLQMARALLTRDGASEAAEAIRRRMATYHHPHVAETFSGAPGLNLNTLRQRPGQIIFLTPDIRSMESQELTDVYGFLVTSLRSIGALHHIMFSMVEPALVAHGGVL